MAADTAVGMGVDTEVDKVADEKKSELGMVANTEVDKVVNMEAGMVADEVDKVVNIDVGGQGG